MGDLILAFLLVAGGCQLLTMMAPSGRGSWKRFMHVRGALFVARAALVVTVVAVGCGVMNRRPWAMATGSIVGWAASAGWEAWRQERRQQGGRN